MSWEKMTEKVLRRSLPRVKVLSSGQMIFNATAVRELGIKPGPVSFVVDRDRKMVGIRRDSRSGTHRLRSISTTISVSIVSVLDQIGIPVPDRGTALFSTVRRERGMLVVCYRRWGEKRQTMQTRVFSPAVKVNYQGHMRFNTAAVQNFEMAYGKCFITASRDKQEIHITPDPAGDRTICRNSANLLVSVKAMLKEIGVPIPARWVNYTAPVVERGGVLVVSYEGWGS